MRPTIKKKYECPETVVIKTTGDRVLDRPLRELGGKGLAEEGTGKQGACSEQAGQLAKRFHGNAPCSHTA